MRKLLSAILAMVFTAVPIVLLWPTTASDADTGAPGPVTQPVEAEAIRVRPEPGEPPVEDPDADKPEYNIEATAGTAYDFDYVVRVVTAEAGGGSDDLIWAVCQCIKNASFKTGLNPEQVCHAYRYAKPYSEGFERVEQICERCFLIGYNYGPVQDATLFYAPQRMNGAVPFHETQKFIIEIDGVRFFEEEN